MIALIEALKKYFQNALDKNLLTDRLQLTKKFKSTKETPTFKICTYLSNALKNSRETRPVGKFFTRIVIAFISWECLSSSETPSWGVISPTIHSVK